ncbi:MAG TPA: hypothetical protein VJT50_03040, partial [Pyrinomonadaceae bacterium]|nr:hypothetical protein [Pyrinomonadaceae bacterium]
GLLELVVIDGQQLTINGNDTFNASQSIAYAAATRAGDCYRLETPEGIIDLALPVSDLEKIFAETKRVEL